MVHAQPDLLASGRFYVIEQDGDALACGGWSFAAPGGGAVTPGTAHVRHVATDPDAVRRGLARRLLTRIIDDAGAAGATRLEAFSTRTAVPFYAAMGFAEVGRVSPRIGGRVPFPSVRMVRD